MRRDDLLGLPDGISNVGKLEDPGPNPTNKKFTLADLVKSTDKFMFFTLEPLLSGVRNERGERLIDFDLLSMFMGETQEYFEVYDVTTEEPVYLSNVPFGNNHKLTAIPQAQAERFTDWMRVQAFSYNNVVKWTVASGTHNITLPGDSHALATYRLFIPQGDSIDIRPSTGSQKPYFEVKFNAITPTAD